MRVLHLFLSLILLTTTCFGQYLKPLPGMPFVNRTHRHARGLKAFWLFNERSGNKVFDLSGNNNTGTLVNSPAWVAGIDGSALRLVRANNNEISLVGATGLTSDAWTIIARIKANDVDGCVLAGWDELQPAIYLQLSTTGKPIFYMGANNYQYVDASAWTKIKDGNYHIVAASMPGNAQADITSAKFYVDGVLYANGAGGDGAAPAAKSQLNLFAPKATMGREMDGDASWFMYYNRVLSAGEIAELYREPFAMFQKDNTALIASVEAPPPPTGGQFIMIQMSMIPLFLIFTLVCFIRGKEIGK